MNLSEPFIRRPVMTVVLTLSAILFGVLAYFNLPVNDLPAVDYPVIQVDCAYPGASPETVASTIATPLERQFMQIPGLELVTSKSSQGNCSLTLQFVLDKSIDAAATDVQAAISRAAGQLPVDLPSPPTFTKTNPNDQPIMYVGLVSDSMTKGQVYDIASTQVQQRLSILPGVSKVDIYGSKSAIRIKADPSALAARSLTMDDLASAIQRATTYQGAGQFDGPNRTFLLQPQGQLDNADAYGNLIVTVQNGSPVYLKDVAKAESGVEDERVDMRFWVRGREVPKATVVLAVFRQAGANAVAVSRSIYDIRDQIQKQLPGSVVIIPIHDLARTIVNSVKDVKETLYLAFILVVMVIFLFLGRATDTLIPVVALPLSLLLTFMAMNFLGYSLDNLSLMALTLAIGFLVDDAIVFLENAVRRMEKFDESPLVASINGAKEISFTILSMTLSLAVVFLPLVFMSGLIGRIFREFAVTIVISILASGVVSLTITPLMCARMLGQRGHGSKKSILERFSGAIERRVLYAYGTILWFFLRQRWISAIIWIICFAGTIYLFIKIPKGFLPVGDSSFSWGVLVAQEGTSPDAMRDYQTRAENVLHANPSIDMTFTLTGMGRFLGSNQGLLLAFLKDPKDRPPFKMLDGKTIQHPDIEQISNTVAGQLMMNLPGAIGIFTPQPVLQISTGASARQAGQFAYSISGIDPKEVYAAAGKMQMMLFAKLGTVFSTPPYSDMYLHTPQLQINILREQAHLYGVSAEKIEALLRNAYSQNYVYLIKKADDQYQVILEVKDDQRGRPEDLQKLYVRSDDGLRTIPLSAVATWTETLGPQAVNHINQFTSVTFNFNLLPGIPTSEGIQVVADIAKQCVPSQLRGEFQGQALTFQQTMKSLTILMIFAVFVMYVILAILYESYVHPLTVLSTLPTALVGGLATLFLYGYFFQPNHRPVEASLYAFVGLFMLMGIVKKNGIMIVDFALQRIDEGETAERAIHDASMDRFRPIIMTSLAALMGAIPIAIGWGSDGGTRQPLGLVIVGGLIVSQLLTLFITPALYLYMELFQEKILDRIPFFRSSRQRHSLNDTPPGGHEPLTPLPV
ncbi:MAG TPA: efflux RND transporter permease subunit [Tepidisphaeraceae bacterium]|jgi:HAE1 family hydrophobic/amphiphilic exporter-1|nr:efflux RND transporter permease subunit [Tepidisphaeraceae bacterium]